MRLRGRRPAGRATVAIALALWAVAASAAAADSGRDALIARWLAANPQTRIVQPDGAAAPPPHLRTLAVRELSSGYHLTAVSVPAAPRDPWWLQAWRWVTDRWNQLWNAAFGRARLGRRGAVAIGDVLLVAAVAVVALAAWRLLSALLFDRTQASPQELLSPRSDPGELYAAACERARAGDYARASRLLFGAAIGSLTHRGILPDDPSATVGDLRRAVRKEDAGLVTPFDAVSSAFVTGTYAELPVDAPAWERALHGYLALGGGEPS